MEESFSRASFLKSRTIGESSEQKSRRTSKRRNTRVFQLGLKRSSADLSKEW